VNISNIDNVNVEYIFYQPKMTKEDEDTNEKEKDKRKDLKGGKNGTAPDMSERPPKNKTTSVPSRKEEDARDINTNTDDFVFTGTYNKTKGGPLVFGELD
jgi:hypothetical protein